MNADTFISEYSIVFVSIPSRTEKHLNFSKSRILKNSIINIDNILKKKIFSFYKWQDGEHNKTFRWVITAAHCFCGTVRACPVGNYSLILRVKGKQTFYKWVELRVTNIYYFFWVFLSDGFFAAVTGWLLLYLVSNPLSL